MYLTFVCHIELLHMCSFLSKLLTGSTTILTSKYRPSIERKRDKIRAGGVVVQESESKREN